MGNEEQLVFRPISLSVEEDPKYEVIEVNVPAEKPLQFSTKLSCQTNKKNQLEFIYEWNELTQAQDSQTQNASFSIWLRSLVEGSVSGQEFEARILMKPDFLKRSQRKGELSDVFSLGKSANAEQFKEFN